MTLTSEPYIIRHMTNTIVTVGVLKYAGKSRAVPELLQDSGLESSLPSSAVCQGVCPAMATVSINLVPGSCMLLAYVHAPKVSAKVCQDVCVAGNPALLT
jgi:hypothetical protein